MSNIGVVRVDVFELKKATFDKKKNKFIHYIYLIYSYLGAFLPRVPIL